MTMTRSALRDTQVINVLVGTGHQLALGFKTEVKQELGQKNRLPPNVVLGTYLYANRYLF